MSHGPLEYVVIEFPGNRFTGEIVPALRDLVSSGTIRIADLIFLRKDADGGVDYVELAALEPDQAEPFGDLDGEVSGLLSEEDLLLAAAALAPDSSAAVLVWENVWTDRFRTAVRAANGRLVAHDRIPDEAYDLAVASAPA